MKCSTYNLNKYIMYTTFNIILVNVIVKVSVYGGFYGGKN